jgi:hypothetical protein
VLLDPFGKALEFKAFADRSKLFAKQEPPAHRRGVRRPSV